MTRVLFATVPATGHVRPSLPIARELVEAGHEVVWYTGRGFEKIITSVGARFVPVTADLKFDADVDALQSTDDERRPGIAGLRKVVFDVFVDSIPAYVDDLRPLFDDFRPEVVVGDQTFMAAPLLALQRDIPRVIFCLGPMSISSVDTAPFGTGLTPSDTPLRRLRNRALGWAIQNVIFGNSQRAAERIVADMGVGPFRGMFTDWSSQFATRFIQAGIPEFEYPRSDLPESVEFIGITRQTGLDDWTAPDWWDRVLAARAEGRPVVVVTQGSAATDHGLLVLPTIEALAERDVLVVATTVTRDPEEVLPREQRPANLVLERFVPFAELLPLTDVLVTNGGYGGVQMSLSFGVPLVVAGTSEDKMESNARLAWTGAGLSLNTNRPKPAKVDAAVRRVLGDPSFRRRASELMGAYDKYGGTARAAEIIIEAHRERQSPSESATVG
ncbi:glycosyltransferase [Allostreptomyces psammosilenae]|uniref:UDP:flavonoid glycosyltransferase YjiC (YdhE family) n=1 Tax=Allostreptomyces psammosilenae TaxID=1892865 RepID=A0A853A0T0_9ACTN|nr:nucleotide disphospho-sugar-binding domain-containing protein [Allostreptomyces psammosilenae]NYI04008.1 UDP:flavonoid glycosyltransferase YjiC (YdhE family) [Allostreptomyces psammosilenae]